MTLSKRRLSNLELYRCLAMLLILANHYVVGGGLKEAIWDHPSNPNGVFLLVFGAFGKTGINCFVLITGYFMCKSEAKIKKWLYLFTEVFFYNFLGYAILSLLGLPHLSFKDSLPINQVMSNFNSCFLLFYLFIPFLNILVQNMTEKQHRCLIYLCIFTFTLLGLFYKITINYVLWFCVLYIISSYIRLYPSPIFQNKKIWGYATIISFLLSIISIPIYIYISVQIDKRIPYYLLNDSNTLLALSNGICSFLFFKNLSIPYSRFINKIASTTFGILLIHINVDCGGILWQKILHTQEAYSFELSSLICHAIGCIFLVFVCCSLLDCIREIFFNKIFNKIDEEKLKKKLNLILV